MTVELYTPEKAFDQHRADYSVAEVLVSEELVSTYGLADGAGTGAAHRSDIAATLFSRLPNLVGEIALAIARGDDDEAVKVVTDALVALHTMDAVFFQRAPSEAEFVKVLRKMMPPATARGHAARSGVEERRREAYVLVHRFADEKFPRRNVPEVERRNGTVGLPLMQARVVLDDVLEGQTNPTFRAQLARWTSAATAAPENDGVDGVEAADTIQNEKE